MRRRWVYELEKVQADPSRDYLEYTEPRSPAQQKAAEALTRQRDRVHVFAPFWGLYPRTTQSRLQAEFGFAAPKWTAVTATGLLVCAAVQLCSQVLAGGHAFLLASAVYFIGESFYRLLQSKVFGRPAASLLGCVLQVFFSPPRIKGA